MKINDEMLSGFLDAELDDEKMNAVREAMAEDDTLVERLAVLANVDHVVRSAAEKATDKPLPGAITDMLDSRHGNRTPDNVVFIGLWKKAKQSISVPVSLAAGVAVMVGLSVFNLQSGPSEASWNEVASVMDKQLTGETVTTDEGVFITPQLSFQNHDGAYCRQVEVQHEAELNQLIGCKNSNGDWSQVAKITLQQTNLNYDYQTASGNNALDDILDDMIATPPLNRSQEQQAIDNHWSVKPVKE